MFGFGKKSKKTAVLVIPPKQYDEEELHILEKALKHHHIKYTLASSSILGPIQGMHNEKIKPELKITDIKVEEIDAMIFIGGPGAREFVNDGSIHRVIQKANKLDKVLAAIDYAPLILAHAEILNGKCATVLETEEHKLQAAGAHYTGTAIEIDGNIITAKDSVHAKEFADIVARMVQGEVVTQAEIGT